MATDMKTRLIPLVAFLAVIASISFGFWNAYQNASSPAQVVPTIAEIKRQAFEHWRRGEFAQFVAVLENVPDLSSEKPRALLEQARGFLALHRARDMERSLARCLALERAPDRPSEVTAGAWATLIDHYMDLERFEDARDFIWKDFDAGAKRGRLDHTLLLQLLRMRCEQSEPTTAMPLMKRFLASDPEDYYAHRLLGVLLTRTGKPDDARHHLQTAVNGLPTTPCVLESWLWYLFGIGDIAEVELVLKTLPPEFEKRPEFWIYRGKTAEARKDSKAAVVCYSNALALAPKHIEANNLLARAMRAAGARQNFDEHVAHCKELAEADREVRNLYSMCRMNVSKPPTAERCDRLAELCRKLGWDREADAWRRFGTSIR